MASSSKKTKIKRAAKQAKMGKDRKKKMSKPGTYKLLPLHEEGN